MKRKQHLLFNLILLCIVVLLFSVGTASADIGNWIIDGDTVYVDNEKVYLSAEPHSLTSSGYVYFDINPKTYTGDIDLYFGFSSGGLKPTKAYYNNNGEWVNIASYFNKINYEYDGFDTWYHSNNLPVNAGNTYTVAVWMEKQNEITFGKYGFAVKPSSQTFSQAISSGNLFYLDPWWDSNWSHKTETNFTSATFPCQVGVTIHNGSGVNNFTDVFLHNNANINFTDVRFLLNDTTELSYWIEDNSSDPIVAWVNITSNGTLGLYYGNPIATDNTSAIDTFPFFDGFEGDLSQWITNGAQEGTPEIVANPDGIGNVMKLYHSGGNDEVKPNNSIGKPSSVGYKLRTDTTSDGGVIGFATGWWENSILEIGPGIPTASEWGYYDGSWKDTNVGYSINTWYELQHTHTGTQINVSVNGTQILTETISTTPTVFNFYSASSDTLWIDDFRILNYSATATWESWSGQLPNTPPTVPTINSPSNNSVYTFKNVILNVSSTDIEGQNIEYYFYGDMIDGSTFIGTNDSVDGNTFNWSITDYGKYHWKARAYDGLNYSGYSDVYSFTLFTHPDLTSPENTSTIYTTYPPLTSTVLFKWEDLAAPQYRLMIAEDINFNIMSVDTHVGTNSSTHTLLVNKEYFWKVYSYDSTTYSNSSDVYSFNLTGNSTLTGSAIEGVVYQVNGGTTAISGAEVTIWNTTWSSSMLTGSNGYYVFEDLNNGTVYSLQAKSDRYWDSSIALVSAEDNPVTNNFYMIDDLTDTEWWHYVEFTVQNVWGVTYPNVATKVYIEDSVTASDYGNTESDGTISFHMDQNVQYHITFINATLGINEDITLYPISTSYKVYIDSYSFDLPEVVTDDIQAYIVSSRINATHGYINFTWSDTSDLTTSINYYISDVDGNELYNTSTNDPDLFDSQIVAATDDRYIVRYVGIHPTHGIIDKTETVVFRGGRIVDFGWDSDWQYAVTSLAFLIFIGALFGAKTAHYGAITVVMFAWIFKWIGWLNETNTSTILIILAAVIAFGWSLRKSEEVKM